MVGAGRWQESVSGGTASGGRPFQGLVGPRGRALRAAAARWSACRVGVVLLLASLLTAAPARALEPVRLQLKWLHHFQFAGYYVALEEGYYRDAGLDVTILEGGPTVEVEHAVAEGRAELGVGTSALLLHRAQGHDLVVVAQVYQHSAAVLLTPRRTGITTVEQMAGRRFMYSNQHGDVLALLRKHGVDVDGIEQVPHQGDPRDLLEGKADVMVAYSFNEPFVLERAGEPYLSFSPRAAGFDFYGDNLFTTRRLAEERPELVAAFRDATLRGWRQALQDKGGTVDLILRRYSQARSREWLLFEASQTEALVQPELVELGYQSPTRWRRIGEVFADLGMLPRGFDTASVVYAPPAPGDHRLLGVTLLLSGLATAVLAGLVLSFRRINRRLQAEVAERQASSRALAERETLLRTVFDTAPVGIFLLDKEGRITLLNPAGQAIWGGVRLVGVDRVAEYKGWSPVTGRRLRNEDWGSTRAVVKGETSLDEEVEIEAFDGTRKVITNSAVPLRDQAGAVEGAVVIISDITARKRAEQSVRESEERLRATMDAMPVAIGVTVGRRIDYLNATFVRTFGYGREEVPDVDAWYRRAYPEADYRRRVVADWEAAVAVAVRTGAAVPPTEVRVRCQDGADRLVLINATPFRDRLLVIFTDLTERERLQGEILKLQKLESLGVLAGGIAHDFNNILTGILGNVSLARAHLPPGEEAGEILASAEQASRRAADLAQQLLTFAKGSEPVRRSVPLRRILEDTTSLVLRGTSVTAQLELPAALRPLHADEGQIGQAFTNVVLNAVQAMPQGGTITIAAEEVEVAAGGLLPPALDLAPGPYLHVTVADAGPGIAAEDLRRIFDPYFTTKATGSGLGLASAHSIVRKHGGAITARSAPGQGAVFEFWLPVSGAPAAPAETAPPMPAGAGPTGRRVLVMDDEPVIRDLARRVLERLGYRVRTCEAGEEAIASYQEARAEGDPYAAVVMDLTIRGGLGGAEAARRILAIDPDARLVVSSGYSTDPAMAEPGRFGFRATLAKPYQVTEVAQVLSRLLG